VVFVLGASEAGSHVAVPDRCFVISARDPMFSPDAASSSCGVIVTSVVHAIGLAPAAARRMRTVSAIEESARFHATCPVLSDA